MPHSLPGPTFSRNVSGRHAQLVHASHETCFIIARSDLIMVVALTDHNDDMFKR